MNKKILLVILAVVLIAVLGVTLKNSQYFKGYFGPDPLPRLPLPDLTVNFVGGYPNLHVSNIGMVDVKTKFRVRVTYISLPDGSSVVRNYNLPGLRVGVTGYSSLLPLDASNWKTAKAIKAKIDFGNRIIESNEDNNEAVLER